MKIQFLAQWKSLKSVAIVYYAQSSDTGHSKSSRHTYGNIPESLDFSYRNYHMKRTYPFLILLWSQLLRKFSKLPLYKQGLLGVSAFIATNIYDIFVLIIFFPHPKYYSYNIILASIQEIATLVFISGLGSLLALLVVSYIIGLFGILPIAIGIMKIKQLRKGNDSQKQKV